MFLTSFPMRHIGLSSIFKCICASREEVETKAQDTGSSRILPPKQKPTKLAKLSIRMSLVQGHDTKLQLHKLHFAEQPFECKSELLEEANFVTFFSILRFVKCFTIGKKYDCHNGKFICTEGTMGFIMQATKSIRKHFKLTEGGQIKENL